MNGAMSTKPVKTHEPLKPCPFCGSPATAEVSENYKGDKEYRVKCTECFAEMAWFQKKPLVVAWNERAKG